MEIIENSIAKKLLQMKTFRLQRISPFIWANGWSSPVYFDDRKILSYPYMRNFITLELARQVAEQYPDADMIAGVANNAIALGALVAAQLGLPFVYVYPSPKDHGLENQIEGELRPRQRVVIIENQVNVGTNVRHVAEAIRNNGCTVLGVITIFDYSFSTTNRKLQIDGIELTRLTRFETVIQEAQSLNIWTEEDIKVLQTWHKSPSKWQAEIHL